MELIKQDPDARWIGLGDYADCIMPSDPRWSFRGLDWKRIGRDDKGLPDVGDLAQQQVNLVDSFFEPIWDQCIGLLEGNHEQVFERHYFTNLTKRLTNKYHVPYLGQTALIKLTVDDGLKHHFSPIIFAEHGATGGGTPGNAINSLAGRLNQWDADILLKGHIHRRGILRHVGFGWGARDLVAKHRVLVLTGSYLKGYHKGEVTYSEKKAYPPNELGGTAVLIHPRTKVIDAVNVEALGMFSEG